MQLRVVTDQPWDVATDVLVIPIIGEASFDGPLDELDRRAGGAVRALAEFKELKQKRYTNALTPAGDLPAGWLLTVSAGEPAKVDREVAVRVGATAERRLCRPGRQDHGGLALAARRRRGIRG